jgi:hypothetical protein
MLTSPNPAITAYKVYHLGQAKLDVECRRQTPDLHRIVAHASIVDSVRRWSRDVAEPAETVLVDSDSDADSDPFEDSSSDDDDDMMEDALPLGDVTIFDCEVDDDHDASSTTTEIHQTDKVYTINAGVVTRAETRDRDSTKTKPQSKSSSPRRPPPPPPSDSTTYEIKGQNWRRNRPVTVRETAVEVDEDD